jgi:hypothetical protein
MQNYEFIQFIRAPKSKPEFFPCGAFEAPMPADSRHQDNFNQTKEQGASAKSLFLCDFPKASSRGLTAGSELIMRVENTAEQNCLPALPRVSRASL